MNKRIFLFLFLNFFFSFICFSQKNEWRINGKVFDENGEVLIGANIQLKDINIGTSTNFKGEYQLVIPPEVGENPKLIFSYVGCQKKEVKIQGKSIKTVDVTLVNDTKVLEEIVVVGYAVQHKREMTASAVSVVRAESYSSVSAKNKKSDTWKKSGLPENSIRLVVGDDSNDFIPLKATQVAVQIDGFRVRVLLDCFFFNDRKDRLQGTFKIRLPSGATPYYFAFGTTDYLNEDRSISNKNKIQSIPYTLYENNFNLSPDSLKNNSRSWGNVKEARIVSKQKAARAYEETVSARIDPALMEWSGSDMFTCNVFPLEINKLHRVVIGYDLNMIETIDAREFILTLPDSKELIVNGNIYSSENCKPIISTDVVGNLQSEHLSFTMEKPKKREITFRYETTKPLMLTSKDSDFFASNVRISLPEEPQDKLPKDAVFLLDISLSSQPDKFNIWLKTINEILSKNKDVLKRFSVLMFNIDKFWWHDYYVKNNSFNVNEFMEYANTLALEGATDFGSALAEASQPNWLKKNEPKHIFVMSDGDFNWGESNMQAIRSVIRSNDFVHTYKTGLSGTNIQMLDYLSRETGAFSFSISGEEEVELTAKSFRYRPWKIENIKVSGIEDFLIQGQPSQLYNGQKLIFTGRNIPNGDIRIQVNNGLQSKELVFSPTTTINSDLTNRIYGQIALSQLENYQYELDEAIGMYSSFFRIPNQEYSFLMLESEHDYRRFSIDNYDSKNYVQENTVEDIIDSFLGEEGALKLGNGKNDFITWLKNLEDNSDTYLQQDSLFTKYINSLPDEIFNIKMNLREYLVRKVEQQTDDEAQILAEDNVLFDNLLNLAKRRETRLDALKLLSSIMEKNPGDFIALRDMAIKAIEWNLGEQAFYMMRRIISNRQYDALAYLIAAQALAKSGNIDMSLIYYYICLNSEWDDDYGSFKEITALQCSHYLKELQSKNINNKKHTEILNNRQIIINNLKGLTDELLKEVITEESDVVIIINWNTDNTDVDLHVLEPTSEDCYYRNRHTQIDGNLSIDVTSGYGPEMYFLKKAPNGNYKVSLTLYSNDNTKTTSKSKVYVDFYRNWGRKNEKHLRKTVVLQERAESQDLFQFTVKKRDNDLPKK